MMPLLCRAMMAWLRRQLCLAAGFATALALFYFISKKPPAAALITIFSSAKQVRRWLPATSQA